MVVLFPDFIILLSAKRARGRSQSQPTCAHTILTVPLRQMGLSGIRQTELINIRQHRKLPSESFLFFNIQRQDPHTLLPKRTLLLLDAISVYASRTARVLAESVLSHPVHSNDIAPKKTQKVCVIEGLFVILHPRVETALSTKQYRKKIMFFTFSTYWWWRNSRFTKS